MRPVNRIGHWRYVEPLAPAGEPTRHHLEGRTNGRWPDEASANPHSWERFGYWHYDGPGPRRVLGAIHAEEPRINERIRRVTLRLYIEACRASRTRPDTKLVRDLSPKRAKPWTRPTRRRR
jgi:hypothetical protein